MPQHDPDDEDFWTRSRRTRQSDKASKRGKKPKEEGGGKAGIDWTETNMPPAAPPAAPSRREPPPAAPSRREPAPAAPPPRREPKPLPAAPPSRREASLPPAAAPPRRDPAPPPLPRREPTPPPVVPPPRPPRSAAQLPPQAPPRSAARPPLSDQTRQVPAQPSYPADAPPSRRGQQSGSARPDTSRPPGAARRSASSAASSTTNGPHLVGRTTPPPSPGADPGWSSAPLTRRPTADQPPTRQQAAVAPPRTGGRTGVRTTGENPSLEDRLEGLASRATTSQGGAGPRPAPARPPMDETLAPDPLVEQRVVQPPRQYEDYEDNYGGDLYEDSYTDDEEPYDDDFADAERKGRPGCLNPLAITLTVLGVFCVLVVMGAFWIKRQIDPGGPPGPEVQVEIVAGQSTSEIGETLDKAGVIESASVWTWYIRLKGGGDIQAGVYNIHTNLSMDEALEALEAKPLPPGTKRVTVPEGQTLRQMQDRLTVSDKKIAGFTPEGFAAALADPSVRSKYLPPDQTSLEGTFFPNTYDLPKDGTEKTLLTKMRDEFDATMDELQAQAASDALGRSPYEVLIVASIVEKEAGVDADRAKVARVIYNRLGTQALYIDAINCYEKQETPCHLTDEDLAKESPYNSRKSKQLPPTPISAPGKASIEAALHPAEGPWLYYVLDPQMPPGEHYFTDNYDDFVAAKARCKDAGLGCG